MIGQEEFNFLPADEPNIWAVALCALIIVAFLAVILVMHRSIERERHDWQQERRFLTDRAIARHTGEVVALDKMEDRRVNGAPEPREHVPTLLEGL